MNKLLSIIVPTYNMQNYLRHGLNSLIMSDKDLFSLLEVIIVNDGSKDKSSAIAHEFEDKYHGVFRVIDKENGNYGSCVNHGLAEAKGKYLRVLDADDWFETSEFEKYMAILQNLDVDMVLTDLQQVEDSGNCIKKHKYDLNPNQQFNFQEYTNPGVYFAMPTITYRTEILRDMHYHQTEGISYTDTEFVFYPQHRIQSCIYVPCDIYRYLMGREGQTMDNKVLLKSTNHYDKLLRAMVTFANNLSEQDKQLYTYQRIEAQIAHLSMGVYRTCLVLQDANNYDKALIKAFDDFMRKERPAVYKQAGQLTLKKYLPIHYVRYWRITGKRFLVDRIRDTYRKIRYGK